MQFVPNLQTGHLVQRYQRFLADIQTEEGTIITAHCPNTGPMTGLVTLGEKVAFSLATKPRKLGYTWEMACVQGTWVGTNTQWPNRLVKEGFEKGHIQSLHAYDHLQSEVRVGQSRLDFYASQTFSSPTVQTDADSRSCVGLPRGMYIEVKNVHWRCGDHAFFPDTVTRRGTKHLYALIQLVQQGYQAMMIYVVQRNDCQAFSVASHIDPDYARAFDQAIQAGVQVLAYACEVSTQGISLGKSLPIERISSHV